MCDRHYGHKALQTTTVQDALKDFSDTLDVYGATKEVHALRISEGLHAMETKFFQFKGRITAVRDVVNWDTRLKTAELLAKIRGYVQTGVSPNRGLYSPGWSRI